MITVLAESGTLLPDTEITLAGTEGNHLRVRRVRSGERIRLLDGVGTVADGVLLADPPEGAIRIERCATRSAPAALILAVGSGDRDRFGWMVEKAAELGVTDLIPLETERTAGVASGVRPEHLPKLRRRALEAIKQCGAAWAPRVQAPGSLAQLLARRDPGLRLLADPAGDPAELVDPRRPVLVVVGPEGGLTEGERRDLIAGGFRPVRLGPHVLRFETAAVAAAVICGSLREELGDE